MSFGDKAISALAAVLLAAIVAGMLVVFGEPRRQPHARLNPSPQIERLVAAAIGAPAIDREIKVSAIKR